MERARQHGSHASASEMSSGATPGKSSLVEATPDESSDATALSATGRGEGPAPTGGDGPDARNGLIGDAWSGLKGLFGGGHAKPFVTHQTRDVAPGNPSRSRLTVGVGEVIGFKANMQGAWKATSAREGAPLVGTGDEYYWTAPDTGPQNVKVTFTVDKHDPVEMDIQVLPPQLQYTDAKKVPFPGQAPGKAGVAMTTTVHYGPDTVSFKGLQWWEKPGPPSDASGYFRERPDLPRHEPTEEDLEIGPQNRSVDWVDKAAFWGATPPYSNGGMFTWNIPTYYAIHAGGTHHLLRNVEQTCTLTKDGTMYVMKDGLSVKRSPSE